MNVCIFEDKGYKELYPLTYLRPSFELRCGLTTLEEKLLSFLPNENVSYGVREALVPLLRERRGENKVNQWDLLQGKDLLLLNGAWLSTGDLPPLSGPNEAAVQGQRVLYIRLEAKKTAGLQAGDVNEFIVACLERCDVKNERPDAKVIGAPWDLIEENPEAIGRDFEAVRASRGEAHELPEGATLLGDPEQLWIAPSAEIQPFTLLDVRGGPIVIEEDAIVTSFTRIEGPACLGKESQTFGAKIREGTSIGPVCRIGGEVEEAIFHAYSNKYHDGFIGHSYVCEWVNLGALCTNSDLKNDYSTVTVHTPDGPKDTGSTKVGSFIGDHTKTSIGTLLNTGSWVGIMCNLLASGSVLPKLIPSYAWYVGGKITKGFGLDAMLKTCRMSMSRRGVDMTDTLEDLLRQVRDETKDLRLQMAKKDRRKK